MPRPRALGFHPSVRPYADGIGAVCLAAASFVARAVLSPAPCRRASSAFARVSFAASPVRARRPATCFWPRSGLTKSCRWQWRKLALAADGPRLVQASFSAWDGPWCPRPAGRERGRGRASARSWRRAPRARWPCQGGATVEQEGRQNVPSARRPRALRRPGWRAE